MKTTKLCFSIVMAILFNCGTSFSNGFERPDSRDYINGVSALNDGDIENAYRFLNKEIENNPDNGYAHCYMSLVCNACNNIRMAMEAVNSSLELIPESDKEYRSFAYYTRSILWNNIGKYEYAINDISQSITLIPDDAENFKTRAEIYLRAGLFDKAIDDISNALKIDKNTDVTELMMKIIETAPTDDIAVKIADLQSLISENR